MTERHLLVGLGNPGPQYLRQRHNVGFLALDTIRANQAGFSAWKSQSQALVSEGRIGDLRLLLVKPQSYMNRSGQPLASLLRFYKLDLQAVSVIHDDLDLAPGKLRVKRGGGHGGHNGLRSIDAHLGPGYRRLRIGIGHPGDKHRVSGYVLHDFSRADQRWLEPLLLAISAELPRLLSGDEGGFASRVMQNQVSRSQALQQQAKPGQADRAAGERGVKVRPGLRIHRQLPSAQPEHSQADSQADENSFARVLKGWRR